MSPAPESSEIARRAEYYRLADALEVWAENPALHDSLVDQLRELAQRARRDADLLVHASSAAWRLLTIAAHHRTDADPKAPLDPDQAFRLTLAAGHGRHKKLGALADLIEAALELHHVAVDDPSGPN